MKKINLKIEKVLNGYLLTLVSRNKVYCEDREKLNIRINEEIDSEVF
jgi:hypothetical protein